MVHARRIEKRMVEACERRILEFPLGMDARGVAKELKREGWYAWAPDYELEALEKTLKAISIPLGSSVGAFHGGSGLIRIYHGREGWIDFFYRNIEQPQWDPLLAFIHETTERFLPSTPSEAWELLR
ncbi:MAG: hypothetical protein ABW346_07210 [Terrimicrobium sp.]